MNSGTPPRASIEDLLAGREILLAACSRSMPQDFPQQMSRLVDNYFAARIDEAVFSGIISSCERVCVVAVGGYGRGQLAPCSDLDVLLLTDISRAGVLEELAGFLFHPLWDLKFEVGHGVRTVKQNLSLAASDFKVLASLLDLRFIAGHKEPYRKLSAKFRDKIIPSYGSNFCKTLWEKRSRLGAGMDSVVLEPDLKNGWGTLRDSQFIRWCAAVKGDYLPLSAEDLSDLCRDEALLMRARCAVHFMRKRKQDKLVLDILPDVASLCGVKGYNPARRGNDLLTAIHQAMVRIRSMGDALFRESFDCKNRTFIEFNGLTGLDGGLAVFETKSRTGYPLTREARRAVSNINEGADPGLGESLSRLIDILKGDYGWRTSLEMLDSGLLKSFLPEFAKVSELVPYDGYHQYPPGRHSLLTVHKCCDIFRNEFSEGGKCISPEDFNALVLAALFHDIGKGKKNHSERGARIAEDLLSNTDFSDRFKEDVVFLIRQHLLLVKASRSIDLSSLDALRGIAGIVRSPRRLRMLFILSVADSMATGPRVWNSWSESLLREIYSGLELVLTDADFSEMESEDQIAEAVKKLRSSALKQLAPEIVETMVGIMPERYLIAEDPDEIVLHMRQVLEFNRVYEKDLIRKPAGKGGKGINLVRSFETDDPGRVKLVVTSRDQDFLFAAQSGVLALHSINILSADIFSWSDGTAVNTFIVETPSDTAPADIWARIERSIMYALTGRLSLDYRLHKKRNSLFVKSGASRVPTQISIDNESSETYTLLEVITGDRSGILYDMASLFSRMNVDIRMARISTTGQSVFDVFHIESPEGGKIKDKEHANELVSALEYALSCVYKG
ncbi:HD domain-containing protein [Maridesulfovibrio hydrothermalis]|uniref:Bifunctional uridylyltransferase/uridylyl-removing enzyme n=1 Tax=Maridesulfovibrio hydrothermalis AM13 = DSM 14728 TaxID=1121451 RepID=L0R9D4_9BACT|nr:HD domain-containing protein [Maridesulfovibrio hydrothermalis]CCO23364.1 [Protein-PII] uridylyltransferase [Maridesulfovibrio hydrothermalis AM13 = DSM 14728]